MIGAVTLNTRRGIVDGLKAVEQEQPVLLDWTSLEIRPQRIDTSEMKAAIFVVGLRNLNNTRGEYREFAIEWQAKVPPNSLLCVEHLWDAVLEIPTHMLSLEEKHRLLRADVALVFPLD